MKTAYYAIINPQSPYHHQYKSEAPFPIWFEFSVNGYHWVSNTNRYRDSDLVRLVPVKDSDIYFDAPVRVIRDDEDHKEDENMDLLFQSCNWFKVQDNQCHDFNEFKYIRKDGKKLKDLISVQNS